MNDKDKILVEMPVTLNDRIKHSIDCSSYSYKERPELTTICNYDFDFLNRYLVLCSNRESKDNIELDYKTLKKSKGLYDIRSLDFKIVEANELDSLNLFYIDGRLCGWRRTETGDKIIAEIKSEDDLKDFNKYDKRFETVCTIVQGFFAIIAVLACIVSWIK